MQVSDETIKFLEDTLANLALSSAVALIPALTTSWGIPIIFVPTLCTYSRFSTYWCFVKDPFKRW